MAISKTARALLASQSLAAVTSVDAAEWNLTAAYGGLVAVRLSLPGSVPTTAPTVTFFVGEAAGVKRKLYSVLGSVTAADYPIDLVCRMPVGTMFANVAVLNGATNAITVEVSAQELTTV